MHTTRLVSSALRTSWQLTRHLLTALLCFWIFIGLPCAAVQAQDQDTPTLDKVSLAGLSFRSIGPAKTSGRIADLAVNPQNPSEYYVAVASGGVWKTTNNGTTFQAIFDGQSSYSIGCVTLDPQNENVVWVGTGENNNQRSVAYGDGVYKSEDGGQSWQNMGLKNSEHIGMIQVHPHNSDIIYVAAYGPLWSSGGDRGIYKSTNGGKDWQQILSVSEHTGFNEIHLDPRNPEVLYATAHQRRRHVWTYVSGGPESAIYKSTDGGAQWQKLKQGLPADDKGRIGLALAPSLPDVVYAMIEGHGFYRSTNGGASFAKRSDENSSGNYYVELVPHPTDPQTVYSLDTYMKVSTDGGKTFSRVPREAKHVDEHALWIDPRNPQHMITGNDGGLYETFDGAVHWHFKPNLPVTQFYRVSIDSARPFYNVYGGTQDNFSLAGPSRTVNANGIVNADWYVTNTGDGFETKVDPTDHNIVYAQAQYGWLVRYDKRSGERVALQPLPAQDEEAYRWNWDAPLLISPHDAKTLYFAANKVFKSTDRGDHWQNISPDLTQQIDRHTLPVMGRVQSVDAVSYDRSTSHYGNIVYLDESPLEQGRLVVGTDDGLIQLSLDDGENWRIINPPSDVPERTYVNQVSFSRYDANTLFAVYNNHKNGDFKPYIFRSDNLGKSWQSISGNLPERGSVYTLRQDHQKQQLLFAGTEFGLFFTLNGGKDWRQLKNGLPTIAIRDMEIHRGEDDLVLASFGRGFYILDNYAPLRQMTPALLEKPAHIFPVKDALLYLEASPLGYGADGFLGASYYRGSNPPVGATFRYYLREAPQTLKSQRQKAEKEKQKANNSLQYPTWEELRAEKREEAPYLLFSIQKPNGDEVARFTQAAASGLQQVTWNGRYSSREKSKTAGEPLTRAGDAHLALPGRYQVQLFQSQNGQLEALTPAQPFTLLWLNSQTLLVQDTQALSSTHAEVAELRRQVGKIRVHYQALEKKLSELKAAARNTPNVPLEQLSALREQELRLADLALSLFGDPVKREQEEPTRPGLFDRLYYASNSYYHTASPTGGQMEQIGIIKAALPQHEATLTNIRQATESIQKALEAAGAPYVD